MATAIATPKKLTPRSRTFRAYCDRLDASRSISVSQAAAAWLDQIQRRRRRPIKPSSAATFKSFISKWIDPHLGHFEVADIGTRALRDFVSTLADAGLSAQSQITISGVVKEIVASVTDDEGNQKFPRVWDNERLDLPILNRAEQHAPIVSREQIESVLASSDEIHQALYAVLAGAGLRIGEALCMKLTEDGVSTVFDAASATIQVRKSLWRSIEQAPKTTTSVRSVELPHELSEFLTKLFGDRTGYAFGNGKPLIVSTARTHLNQVIPGVGFHSFRRFFVSHRRATGMNEELLRTLMGHASSDITSRYSSFGKGSDYAAQRRAEVERCGLGFSLPEAIR